MYYRAGSAFQPIFHRHLARQARQPLPSLFVKSDIHCAAGVRIPSHLQLRRRTVFGVALSQNPQRS